MQMAATQYCWRSIRNHWFCAVSAHRFAVPWAHSAGRISTPRRPSTGMPGPSACDNRILRYCQKICTICRRFEPCRTGPLAVRRARIVVTAAAAGSRNPGTPLQPNAPPPAPGVATKAASTDFGISAGVAIPAVPAPRAALKDVPKIEPRKLQVSARSPLHPFNTRSLTGMRKNHLGPLPKSPILG